MKFKTTLILVTLLIMAFFSSMLTPLETKILEEEQLLEYEIKNPGKFIIERQEVSRSLEPSYVTDWHAAGLLELVYEPLITYKGNTALEFRGLLAKNWTISEDGLSYTFLLREDVTFHDGVPFNAYVMKYTLDRVVIMGWDYGAVWALTYAIKGGREYMWGEKNVSTAIDYLNAGGIQVLDEYTLKINLEWPAANFIHDLTINGLSAVSPKAVVENKPLSYNTNISDWMGMVPLDVWFPELTDYTKLGLLANHNSADSGVAPDSWMDGPKEHIWMRNNMVGTGPFKLVEIRPDEFFRLVKNTNWWGTFSEQSVDEIIIKDVPEVNTRVSDFTTGEADMIFIDILDYPLLVDESGAPNLPDIKVYNRNDFTFDALFMNQGWSFDGTINESEDSTYNASTLLRYSTGNRTAQQNNPFTSLLFREAFATIFNYQAFINQVMFGYGERMEGIILNGVFGHHDQLIEEGYLPTYDPEKAKALFQEVGWKGTIVMPSIPGEKREEIAYLIKNPIEALDVGIEIEIEPLDSGDYFDWWWGYPVYGLGFIGSGNPDSFVNQFYHGLEGGMALTVNYNNPDINILIDQVAVEQNATLREQLYHEIEELGANDTVFAHIMQEHTLLFTRDWVQDIETSGSLNPLSHMLNLESIDKAYDIVSPTITSIYHTPESPTESDTVSVFADISDDESEILSATVHYRIDEGSWNNVSMAEISNSYSAIIGSFDTGSFVEYYVSATDDSPKKNFALNDNNGQYYNFLVSTVTTTSSTTTSSTRSGFVELSLYCSFS